MENIIKKVTQQGYALTKNEIPYSLSTRMVCDPVFWQALGVACGWEEEKYLSYAQEFYFKLLLRGWENAIEWLSDVVNK